MKTWPSETESLSNSWESEIDPDFSRRIRLSAGHDEIQLNVPPYYTLNKNALFRNAGEVIINNYI